ncbi:MAG TPA: SDR family oxidoreductase [Actinomycetales bacterium]|nr:SDR family oxidoreductase [Actinomycetales bacterium]
MGATAVVTGATGGVGSAIVRALTGRGYRVLAVGRSAERLEALVSAAPSVTSVVMDLSEPVELPGVLRELDRIDVLVHCAGVADVASVADAASGLWRRVFAVNVVSAAELTQGLLPALRAAAGHVVFVNMAPGMTGVPKWSAYVASKAAQRELADSLRHEEAGNGIRVTTIYPGGTATDLLRQVREQFGRPYDPEACIQPESVAAMLVAALECPPDAHVAEMSIQPGPRS